MGRGVWGGVQGEKQVRVVGVFRVGREVVGVFKMRVKVGSGEGCIGWG